MFLQTYIRNKAWLPRHRHVLATELDLGQEFWPMTRPRGRDPNQSGRYHVECLTGTTWRSDRLIRDLTWPRRNPTPSKRDPATILSLWFGFRVVKLKRLSAILTTGLKQSCLLKWSATVATASDLYRINAFLLFRCRAGTAHVWLVLFHLLL